MFALITPFPQGSIKQAKLLITINYAAACSISLGLHHKRLIHNWVCRLTWIEVVLNCMDTFRKTHKVVSRSYEMSHLSVYE